jgi:hypothetical protein
VDRAAVIAFGYLLGSMPFGSRAALTAAGCRPAEPASADGSAR